MFICPRAAPVAPAEPVADGARLEGSLDLLLRFVGEAGEEGGDGGARLEAAFVRSYVRTMRPARTVGLVFIALAYISCVAVYACSGDGMRTSDWGYLAMAAGARAR
jgi:hypothetical protein